MFVTNALDSEVIDNKDESDWTSGMAEEARSVLCLVIAMGSKVGDQPVVGNFASMG